LIQFRLQKTISGRNYSGKFDSIFVDDVRTGIYGNKIAVQ
jgi:hypothetical protein